MAGMKYTEVLDNIIPWTLAQRELIQEELRYGGHNSVCSIQSESKTKAERDGKILVTYPEVDEVYSPPDQCAVAAKL
jgi:hypothetical protein